MARDITTGIGRDDRVITNSTSKIGPGIDVRGEGGMVLAPPSVQISIGVYSIISNAEIADAPDWLIDLAIAAGNSGGIPDGEREPNPEHEAPLSMVEAAVDVIPNGGVDWETWNKVGMAIYAATGGSAEGFVLFDKFSKKSAKYNKSKTIDKWRSYHSSPPNRIGFGSLHHLATASRSALGQRLRRPCRRRSSCCRHGSGDAGAR